MNKFFLYLVTYTEKDSTESLIIRMPDESNSIEIEKAINSVIKNPVHISAIDSINSESEIYLYESMDSMILKLCKASHTFVYFDSGWKVSYSINNRLNLLNYVKNKKLNIFLIGNQSSNILKNKKEYIEKFFDSTEHITNSNICVYNLKNEDKINFDGLVDIDYIYDGKNDYSNEVVYAFDTSVDIFDIIDFSRHIKYPKSKTLLCNYKNNNIIFYKLDNTYGSIEMSAL